MKKSIILSFILLCATQLCFAITIQSKDVIVTTTSEVVTKTEAVKAEQVKEESVVENNVVSSCCRTSTFSTSDTEGNSNSATRTFCSATGNCIAASEISLRMAKIALGVY